MRSLIFRILFVGLPIFFVWNCTYSQTKRFEIIGVVNAITNGKIRLKETLSTDNIFCENKALIQNGNFSFHGTIKDVSQVRFIIISQQCLCLQDVACLESITRSYPCFSINFNKFLKSES